MDAMQLIEVKKAETEKRVAKLRSQLETAEIELNNLQITSETLSRLGLNPEVETTVPRGKSLAHVLAVLSDSEWGGQTPKEIHDALVASGVTNISQDNVRTVLARNKDRLESGDGRYWRKAENAPQTVVWTSDEKPPVAYDDGDLIGGEPQKHGGFADDLDDIQF